MYVYTYINTYTCTCIFVRIHNKLCNCKNDYPHKSICNALRYTATHCKHTATCKHHLLRLFVQQSFFAEFFPVRQKLPHPHTQDYDQIRCKLLTADQPLPFFRTSMFLCLSVGTPCNHECVIKLGS